MCPLMDPPFPQRLARGRGEPTGRRAPRPESVGLTAADQVSFAALERSFYWNERTGARRAWRQRSLVGSSWLLVHAGEMVAGSVTGSVGMVLVIESSSSLAGPTVMAVGVWIVATIRIARRPPLRCPEGRRHGRP